MRLRTPLNLIVGFALCSSTLVPAKPMPEVALKDLSGHKQRLSDLRGNIVVLNFWATWCGPCQEELPLMSRLSVAYGGEMVRFVAISIDEEKSRAQIAAFLVQRR
jgi:thiol-disulfide isomerase/thioredoxin